MRNDTELGPSAVANYVRRELATSLRSRKPYYVNLLLGGLDPITGKPSLYWLDYLAALAPLPYGAHGYAQYVYLLLLSSRTTRIIGEAQVANVLQILLSLDS
jgi:20S proteasome subunit beta 4